MIPSSLSTRLGFLPKLIVFTVVLIILSVTVSSITAYRRARASLEATLGKELLGVVATAAPLLDGDLLAFVSRGADGKIEGEEEFETIRAALEKVKVANHLHGHGSPLYVMRPVPGDATQLEFVIMTDRDADGSYFVGNRYAMKAHLRSALDGQPTVTRLYDDEEGTWISAVVPIKNSEGKIVAVLQGDRSVQQFTAAARAEALPVLYTACGTLLLGSLLAWFFGRSLVRSLEVIAQSILTLSGEFADSTKLISSSGLQIASRAASQAEGVSGANQALAQAAELAGQTEQHTRKASTLAQSSLQQAESGQQHMRAMSAAAAQADSAANRLAGIIKKIEEIAFSTNILALNAAIEAARAGSQGVGFAVVAEEVRALASQSSVAAQDSAGLVNDLVAKNAEVSRATQTADQQFGQIVAGARQVCTLTTEAGAMGERQNQAFQVVNQAIQQISNDTAAFAASAEESASASVELESQGQVLAGTVADMMQVIKGQDGTAPAGAAAPVVSPRLRRPELATAV